MCIWVFYWSWFFVSGYDGIHLLHVIYAISGWKLNVVRLCVVTLFSYDNVAQFSCCLVVGRLDSVRAVLRLVHR
jgi:hypothetical protein